MKTNKKVVVQDIDINQLESIKNADLNSIPALILTVKSSGILGMDQLPEWIVNYPIPDNTIKSPQDAFKCYAQLIKLQRENGINVHPSNQIDTLLIDTSVTVSDVGIAYKMDGGEKTMSTVCSYLLKDPNDVERLCHASTADLLVTDAKYSRDGKIVVNDWPENFSVPVSDAVKYRAMSGSVAPGRAVPREEIFSYLSRDANTLLGIRLHSLIGKKMKNFSQIDGLDDQIKEIYIQRKAPIPENFSVEVIGIQGGVNPWTDEVETAYRMYFKSISIRGGREGKNVSHGFERFSMSRMNSHMLNMVTDMKKMLQRYKASAIMVKGKAFTNEEIRVLVANGITIIAPNEPYPRQEENSPPGIYISSFKDRVVVEFLKIDDDWVRPELVSKKEKDSNIKFGPYYDNAVTMVIRRVRCFAYIYVDSRLASYENKVSLLPSCTADTLKVIIASGLGETFTVKELVSRGTMAISCRNRFVHYRKPFCTVDPMAKEVGWDTKVILPRLKCKDEKKVVDCSLFTQEVPCELIPTLIDISTVRNKVAQIKKGTVSALDCLISAVANDKEKLFLVMVGLSQDDPSKYTIITDEWRKKYGILLEMEEQALRAMLISYNSKIYDEYVIKHEEVYTEYIPFENAEEKKEVEKPMIPIAPVVSQTPGTGKLNLKVDMRRRRKQKSSSSEDPETYGDDN